MNRTKRLRIGIASRDQMKARTLAIARGDHKPSVNELKVWFTSTASLAKTLSRDGALRSEIVRRAPGGSNARPHEDR